MLYEQSPRIWELTPSPATPPDDARVVLVNQGSVASVDEAHWQPLAASEVRALAPPDDAWVSLGEIDGHLWYALDSDDLPLDAVRPGWHWLGLRDILVQSERSFAVSSRAVQLVTWRRQHRYCGQCGRPTQQGKGEHYRACEPCGLRFYPRISPCIIVLVVRDDEVLLAQGTRHRTAGWYSTLAGFMEPGESAEQAVHREVYEEVGVTLGELRYMNSQTWPFPHQLMLGFIAEYAGGEIERQASEIEHARWWSIDELPRHPPVESISGWLIRQYCRERRGT